ncbi:MAG TPA: 30S ribosome-binding factor RbfA [Opitutales bacterium]|nr:30S ribosome-binding factor RbfA [Opitutales bacterium]
MSERNIRVNELLKREISEVLHTRYKDETVYITILGVQTSPDHRKAHVYFSVIGGEKQAKPSLNWLTRHQKEIRREVGRKIVLKFLPHLQFHYDPSTEKGDQVINLLNELEENDPH